MARAFVNDALRREAYVIGIAHADFNYLRCVVYARPDRICRSGMSAIAPSAAICIEVVVYKLHHGQHLGF